MEHKDNDHPGDDHPDDDDHLDDDDYEYQECQLCCEKTQIIIPCLNEPCDYIICDKCYSRIDDKCPACRTSLTEYKKDLIAEKIIIDIDNEVDDDSVTDTNPRHNLRPGMPIHYMNGVPNDISCCGVICILILLLTFPIIKFFELGGILIQKLIELNTYLSQYLTYQRFKIFSIIILFIFLFRTIGWVTLKSIENEVNNNYILYNYFDFFGFILGLGIGILMVLLFIGLSIIYFRLVLWIFLQIVWLYKKINRYLYPQPQPSQPEPSQPEQIN